MKLRQPTAILVSFPSFLLPLLGLHSNSPAKVTTQFYTAMLAGDGEIACSLTIEESRTLVSNCLSLNHEESKRHPEKYVKYENATASVLEEDRLRRQSQSHRPALAQHRRRPAASSSMDLPFPGPRHHLARSLQLPRTLHGNPRPPLTLQPLPESTKDTKGTNDTRMLTPYRLCLWCLFVSFVGVFLYAILWAQVHVIMPLDKS